MEITFGSQIIKSYKRLSYTPWYALAEFVDNSTESYLVNQQALAIQGKDPLIVEISYDFDSETIKIQDNAMGMSEEDLRNALTIGREPKNSTGRSQYGLGMKTAACWLGNKWQVTTKKLNEPEEHKISVDVEKIANGDLELPYESREIENVALHYTIVEIFDLNRQFRGATRTKIKNFLRSMYRKDFENYGLQLIWDSALLTWDYEAEIGSKLHVNKDGKRMIREFSFPVGGSTDKGTEKQVNGWVGVFEKGSRRDAGFSLIQNNRVIKDDYKPELIFGEQRNDLVNQRLVGELNLIGFFVSHTKDEIIFEESDEDEMQGKLAEVCEDFKYFAQEYRKYLDDERVPTDVGLKALNEFALELNSDLLRDKVKLGSVPPTSVIQKMKSHIVDAVRGRTPESLKANLEDLDVLLFIDPQMSPFEPYVLIELTSNKHEVIIIINSAHPHWSYLSSQSDILNFIRHCTYDGVAEWKAINQLATIEPDTIKYIKDGLLRIHFELEKRD